MYFSVIAAMSGRRVDDLVGRHAGDRAAEEAAGGVAAGLRRLQADGLQAPPDLGHVLDADPVVLEVLPVRDVGGVAGEVGGDAAEDPQPLRRERLAVAADAHHEVAVAQLVVAELRRAPAVDAGAPLGVEPPPAEAARQVLGRDGVEALAGVGLLDALADVEPVVLVLPRLVAVEGLGAVDLPLPVGAVAAGRAGGRTSCGAGRLGDGHVIECITADYPALRPVHTPGLSYRAGGNGLAGCPKGTDDAPSSPGHAQRVPRTPRRCVIRPRTGRPRRRCRRLPRSATCRG